MLALVLGGLVVLVGAIIVAVTNHGKSQTFANDPYSPQVARNFEAVGNASGALSTEAIDAIAKNNAYEFLPKFADSYNIQQHFAETRKLVAAAKGYGNNIRVFDYFSASYWFNANLEGWQPYSEGFQQSWLLRDSSGQTIPFLGTTGATNNNGGLTPVGYLVDLSNPAYRAWAISTIVSWMHAAPYAGISFDSATPMQGTAASSRVPGGASTYNALLCGATYTVDSGDCSRVQAWNQGLVDLLSQTTQVLARMGDQVRYNGIAPSVMRGASRNVGLIKYTDIASNEGFCLSVSANKPDNVTFNSLTADAQIMREFAAQNKLVTEVTNTYQSGNRQKYGDYCVAGFLIGWQPGSSYYCLHAGYGALPSSQYPIVPEQNLNLGDPLTVDYQTQAGALTRQFQHGFVAVNPNDQSVTITVPTALTAFANGSARQHYKAGQTVTLPGHGAILGLNATYLDPGSTHSR